MHQEHTGTHGHWRHSVCIVNNISNYVKISHYTFRIRKFIHCTHKVTNVCLQKQITVTVFVKSLIGSLSAENETNKLTVNNSSNSL